MESVLVTKDMPISSILEACWLLDEAMQRAASRERKNYLRYVLIAGGIAVSDVGCSIREESERLGGSDGRD